MWITGAEARAYGMKLRQGADAILVGVNTILADDPSLTFRTKEKGKKQKQLRRIILDSLARTPLNAKVARDEFAGLDDDCGFKSCAKATSERAR